MVVKARLNYARLSKALSAEGKYEKATAVLDRCMEALPLSKISYDPYMPDVIEAYFAAGDTAKAVTMTNDLCSYYYEQLDYFLKQDPFIVSSAVYEIQSAIQNTLRVGNTCMSYSRQDLGVEINKKLEGYYARYMSVQQVPEK